eukprot:3051119-Pleurochrysis_carterae.AAC.2
MAVCTTPRACDLACSRRNRRFANRMRATRWIATAAASARRSRSRLTNARADAWMRIAAPRCVTKRRRAVRARARAAHRVAARFARRKALLCCLDLACACSLMAAENAHAQHRRAALPRILL